MPMVFNRADGSAGAKPPNKDGGKPQKPKAKAGAKGKADPKQQTMAAIILSGVILVAIGFLLWYYVLKPNNNSSKVTVKGPLPEVKATSGAPAAPAGNRAGTPPRSNAPLPAMGPGGVPGRPGASPGPAGADPGERIGIQ